MELNTNGTNTFSKIPPEILAEIFMQCISSQNEPISPKTGPLLFVQVCRYWREVASSTPSLWQDIRMGRGFKGHHIHILNLFLDYSRNLPLTITIMLPSQDPRLVVRNEVVVDRVLDSLPRILALKGYVSRLFPYYLLKHLSAPGASRRIHAPLLKRIDITGFDIPSEISHNQWTQYIQNCIITPNLEELHLNTSRTVLSMLSFIPESLKVLSGLYITDVAQISDMSFLCQTSNLTTLEFCIYDSFHDVPLKLPSSPVYIPRLKELRLALVGTRFIGILRSFHFPCIERLSLNVRMGASFSQVLELLTKGQMLPLRYLSLSQLWEDFDPASALSCFLKFKGVEEVNFYSFPLLQQTIVQPLMEKEEDDFKLFPQLSSIVIQNATFRTGCRPLLEMLKSRSIFNGGKLIYTKFLDCEFPLNDEQTLQDLELETDGQLKIDIVQDEARKCIKLHRKARMNTSV